MSCVVGYREFSPIKVTQQVRMRGYRNDGGGRVVVGGGGVVQVVEVIAHDP
jgi:hypothetical protein